MFFFSISNTLIFKMLSRTFMYCNAWNLQSFVISRSYKTTKYNSTLGHNWLQKNTKGQRKLLQTIKGQKSEKEAKRQKRPLNGHKKPKRPQKTINGYLRLDHVIDEHFCPCWNIFYLIWNNVCWKTYFLHYTALW